LKAQSSYSQSVDSLPLKELNNEFLKGIQARERVVMLKKIHAADSIQLHIYKDSLIPFYQDAVGIAAEEIEFLNIELIKSEQEKKLFKYTSIGLAIVVLLQIIF
jgi:hypothetical protein